MIQASTRKTLWTRALDQCAFPGCLQALTVDIEDAQTGSLGVTVVGEEAHIRARSVGGPRYDVGYADVDGYENLILMCSTHHTLIDAHNGSGYTVDDLVEMKTKHEKNQGQRNALRAVLQTYLGDRYAAENSVQFQQVDLRGPSVEAMFVDVPVGCRRNETALANFLKKITDANPGDTEELERMSGMTIAGGTQVLLHPEWAGNAILVGGPGQGKSTILQYVCQFHRARRLGKSEYTAGDPDLARFTSVARFPVRIDLRRYSLWATTDPSQRAKKGKKQKRATVGKGWRSLEEFILEDIRRNIGANDFTPQDLVVLLATEPVLFALDGLDEVASLPTRARVVDEIIRMHGRLSAEAADLVILVATRPGTSLQPLTASGVFPMLHLQRLTQGLRLQYLSQWCKVSSLSPAASEHLQLTFMDSQHIPHISELASYPMQLAILLHLLHRRQLLPQQRTELYEEYLKTFLDREQTENKEPLLADKRRVIEDTHAYLGWYLQAKAEEGQSAGSITRDELRELLRTYLSGQPKAQELAEEIYSAITDRVLCLVEREDAFEFEVQSLREYFAALYIFENLTPKGKGNSRDDGLNALLERPYWANVCRFFIGKLSRGEIRSLESNFQEVERKVSPQPLVRAMAVTVLNDRIFDGLTSSEIREVVDFILRGPGVALAHDGVIDPAGNSLRLSEEAGRIQAVEHLKERLTEESSDAARDAVTLSLSVHSSPQDMLQKWWWGNFEPSHTWLRTAALLGVLKDLNSAEIKLLESALRENTDTEIWIADLLITGGYNGSDEAIEAILIESLNNGSAETVESLHLVTQTEILSSCASEALSGPDVKTLSFSTFSPSRNSSQTALRVLDATKNLRDNVPGSSSNTEWNEYLLTIADIWGDGWILRRAVSMSPATVDLSTISSRSQDTALAAATLIESGYRTNRSNAEWWKDHFASSTTQLERMLAVLALLKEGKSSVIVELAGTLDAVVHGFDVKRFRTVERALYREAASGHGRTLNLQEALRLRKVSFSGRTLWLLWIVANDSTRERIPLHLERDLQDVFAAGASKGREAVAAAQTKRKLKVDIFKGARNSLPLGGWAEQDVIGTMTLQVAKSILTDPYAWPTDLVQLAVDKLGARAATHTPPLLTISSDNRWFRN